MNNSRLKRTAAVFLTVFLVLCSGCSLTENEYDEIEEKVSVYSPDTTINYVLATAAGRDSIGNWGGGFEYELYALLANYGQEKKYAPQGDISDFVNGSLTVASAMTYNELGLLRNDYEGAYDMEEVISNIDLNEEGFGMLQDGISCSEKFLAQNPNTAAAFLSASIRGWEYACAHPDEAAIITGKYSGDISGEHQTYMAHEIKKLVETDMDGKPVEQIGQMYKKSMQKTLELCKRYIATAEEESTVRLRKMKLNDIGKSAYFDMAMNDSFDEPEKKDVILRLSWNVQAQFMGFFVAMEKGWYKNAGLNVTVMEGNDNQNSLQLLEEEKADFAVVMLSDLIAARAKGRKVVEIAQLFQRSALNLVYRTEEDKNLLRVAVNPNTYGFSLRDSMTGEYSGMEVLIAGKLAEEMGYEGVKFVDTDEAHRIPLVQEGEADLAISTLTITEERKKLVDFSPPYYSDKVSVLVSEEGNVQSLAGLKGRKIGVIDGSNSGECLIETMIEKGILEASFQQADDHSGSDTSDGVTLEAYQDYASAVKALKMGDIDGVVGDRSLLNSYCSRKYHFIREAFAPQDYGIATKKDGGLTEKVAALITKWTEDGTLKRLQTEWGLNETRFQFQEESQAVLKGDRSCEQ